MANEIIKPVCPDHPAATVLRASIAATERAVWVCSKCGKKLGDAGKRDFEGWEVFEVRGSK